MKRTPTQRAVLRRLAAGETLCRNPRPAGSAWWEYRAEERVQDRTVRALVAAGLLEAADMPLGRLGGYDLTHPVWRLTEVARSVLLAEEQPAALDRAARGVVQDA